MIKETEKNYPGKHYTAPEISVTNMRSQATLMTSPASSFEDIMPDPANDFGSIFGF